VDQPEQESKTIVITYRNWKNEVKECSINPIEIWFGKTEWHPNEQWFLKAFDLSKNEERDFALFDILSVKSTSDDKKTSITTEASVKIGEVKLYTDGGSRGNPGPSASAYVIQDLNGIELEAAGHYIGITTNNQAEYQALRRGLDRLVELGVRRAHVFMDSLLVVNQMKGEYKVKNRDLWPIYEALVELCKKFEYVKFMHVPREMNKQADNEVNRILDEHENGYN
jgi:ribonuclease HI